MVTTNDEKGGRRTTASAVRWPLFATIAIVIVLGVAYYAFYQSQVDYYTGRNLRLLSTLTAQIDGRVGMYSGFFRDGILKPRKSTPAPAAAATAVPAEPRDIDPRRGVRETTRGWELLLQDANGPDKVGVSLNDVLRPLFARRVGAAFDVMLVADAEGTILYSLRTPPPGSSLLTSEGEALDEEKGLSDRNVMILRAMNRAIRERESGSALVVTRLGALSERKGWREYAPLEPAKLLAGTEHLKVRLGDTDYLLFSQPYAFARKPVSVDGHPKSWIVCGLVSASRFRYDVSAVSASGILTAVGIALLALCCWPFLRIALIHPNQELTITDVALIVICTAVGACVLTLAVLDVFAYGALAERADDQLRRFGETVKTDFGDDIVRAMYVLDRAQTVTAPLVAPPPAPDDGAPRLSQPLPAALLADPAVADYPYIDSISWIDPEGKQVARFAARGRDPLSDVGQRQYFRNALLERSWNIGTRRYILEWVRTRTTGEVRAVLAKNTRDARKPVLAMATDLIDLTYAVRPPGVEMAIIEENGEVVYHSDTERIGYENFFAETDRSRSLRSAVLARRASIVAASYWGEEKSMYVRPLTGSRWTLVVFRAQRLARVLNVEAVLLTLMLLLLCALPYVLLYIFTLVVLPRYRAPSIWPDESRRGDYLRLCVIYVVLLVLFGLTVSVLAPWSSFPAVMMIPALAVLNTYLVLHRVGTPRKFAVAASLWIVANAILLAVLMRSDVAPRFAGHSHIALGAVAAVTLIGAALTAILISSSGSRFLSYSASRVTLGYAALYRLCGVLILLLCTALPVAAFFNISRHVQLELLVKFGQLRAAAALENRINRIEAFNVRGDSTSSVNRDVTRPDMLKEMFGSTWELLPPAGNARTARKACEDPIEGDRTVPPAAADLMPALYEDSIAIRPLFEIGAKDGLWKWCVDKDTITLARKVRFDTSVSQKLWPGIETPAEQKIVITSRRTPSDTGDGGSAVPAIVLGGLGLLVAFWYAARFIASRVLLMDMTEPYWMAHLPLSPTLGDHLFLVRRDKDASELMDDDAMGKGLPFLDVSFDELARTGSWDAALEQLDSSAAGRNVRIVDFEHGINDGDMNLQKLRWLERLLSLPDRTVIVISTISPAFVMTTPSPKTDPPADYLERWRRVLDRFVIVTAEELELRHQEWRRRQDFRTRSQLGASAPKNWLERETAYNPFLRRLRDELDPEAEREQLLDEIAERAETYYAGLWASCREDEKLLLYQLARNGLANGRNRRTLRRLIARGLVRRNPNVELFSETFRRYVLAAALREDVVSRARAERGASTWDALRLPFFVIIISFLLLLFATQKDLLTTTATLAAALTTGLPIIMKLVGVFAEKRMGGGSTT